MRAHSISVSVAGTVSSLLFPYCRGGQRLVGGRILAQSRSPSPSMLRLVDISDRTGRCGARSGDSSQSVRHDMTALSLSLPLSAAVKDPESCLLVDRSSCKTLDRVGSASGRPCSRERSPRWTAIDGYIHVTRVLATFRSDADALWAEGESLCLPLSRPP